MITGFLDRFPAGFQMWPPVWQAGVVFLSTFVLEDVAAIGAGLLLATGAVGWPLAFGACFLGIWIGDAGLYGLARVIGRNGLQRSSMKRFSARVEQSERWFAKRGSAILIFSRVLPGARLPTYLAAGFLRLPLQRFLFLTGAASMVWTIIVLSATKILGASVLVWLGFFGKTAWGIVLVVAAGLMVLHSSKKLANRSSQILSYPGRLLTRLERWKHWEFWPAWIFYPPVALYCLWLAIKYRGLTLPTAANPGIFSGGLVGESKIVTLRNLMETSPEFTAEAELLTGSTPEERLDSLREICQRFELEYPFILKPDIGQRGAGVKLIRSEEQAIAYLRQTGAPLVVQRYVPGPHEAGIFYYRYPHESRGHLFAITEKLFPVLTGDGQSTVSELIWADSRARFMAEKYHQRLKGREQEVLPLGQTLKLVEAGNHAQGCIFRDGMRFWSLELAERIDEISRKVPGFYIGRYDIRYSNEEDLRAGRNFKIIELNGAASEATSIYDSRNSVFNAYRTLFRQWDLVFSIGAANRRHGWAPTCLSALWKNWREYAGYAASYPVAD